jgi:zonular occludens toxin Zot
MPVYVVTGKLGVGKGKYTVDKMRSALRAGRRVATNCDLYLEHLMGPQSRATVLRVPDKPSAADLDAIGHGNPDSYDEEKNGVLVLDELGSWLNSRAFAGGERAALVEWLIHARKKGWDVYLIVQALDMIDKQVRVGLAEYVVKVIRADRLRIPVVGPLLGALGKLPRFHIANLMMTDVPGVVVDRDWFRGDDLHKCYDTRQVFTVNGPGLHSYLSAWHLKGRHQEVAVTRTWWLELLAPGPRPAQPAKPKLELVARLAKLPPHRALYWAARLSREGVI